MSEFKKHECDCHRLRDGHMACRFDCLSCNGGKGIKTSETKNYKKVEIVYK